MNARVLLGDVLVGHLEPAGDVIAFTFDEAYLSLPDRPVLGQAFEDRDLRAESTITGSLEYPLPSFFRNALPEGALRKIVEARLPKSGLKELEMLMLLGSDLPGALRVLADPLDSDADRFEPPSPRRSVDPADPIRFSLSGVQLKASVHVDLDDENKITLPMAGEGGRWIAKFPSSTFRDLPENELTMLRWARAAGLDVPDSRIIDVASIENLPTEFPREGRALLVRRFDRSASHDRIHQEDFAQVFEIEPEQKDVLFVAHDRALTYAGIGAIVSALAGESDLKEFTRRLAFMILSGNADAHAKNWSLIYPDRVHARLSPLYDVVSTVAYPRVDRTLPLGFLQMEDPVCSTHVALDAITYRDFRELAEQTGEPANAIESDVRDFVDRARAAWREVRGDAPSFVAEAVNRHLDRVAL